jgi:predicted NUDIX family NTP pyrophosphohydrolase
VLLAWAAYERRADRVTKQSAGLVMYRVRGRNIEILLLHPGGPFWIRKDQGSWTIPKGEIEPFEEPLEAAKREFEEETGLRPPECDFRPLKPVRLRSGKTIYAWSFVGDWDSSELNSISFTLEWPARSGMLHDYPEADRAEWFCLPVAKEKIQPGQLPFVEELEGTFRTAAQESP